MPAVKFDDAYGYLTFEFAAPAGGEPPPPVTVDLYETHRQYLEMHAKFKDDPDPHALGFAWREHLYTLKFPPMSVANATHVVQLVVAEMDRLGKAGAGSGSAG